MGWIKLTICLSHERKTKEFIKPISQYKLLYLGANYLLVFRNFPHEIMNF